MNILLFMISALRAELCPIECRCELSRQRTFCHNRGLVRVPLNIPTSTKILYLQDNMLSSSDLLDSELSKLTQLTRLMLYNNNLTRTGLSMAVRFPLSNPPNGSMGRHGSYKYHALSACRCVATLLGADSRQLVCRTAPRESKAMRDA